MKKKVLTLKLAVSVLSALSIFACAKKGEKESTAAHSTETAKESSIASSTDTEKESSEANSIDTEKESKVPDSKKSENEKEDAGNKVTDTLVGAYNTTLSSFALKDNPKAQKAFQAAFPKDYNGTRYEPIALLGSQVVSGMNYVYLCKSSWTDYQENISFVLLQIYQDLSGKSEVKGSALLFPTEESREDGEDYRYNTGSYQLKDNPEIENEVSPLLKTATTQYTPIAYIGKHTQEGKPEEDVLFSAKDGKGKEAKRSYVLLYIGKEADGKAKIIKTEDVEFPEF